MQDGRIKAGNAWWAPLGMSAFHLIHYARTGNMGEVEKQLDLAAANGISFVRVFGATQFLFNIHPSQAGYWDAAEDVFDAAFTRGLWIELCILTDAQLIMPVKSDRQAFVKDWAQFMFGRKDGFGEIVNESFKNGFSAADDPVLLELGDIFKSNAPDVPYSLSDPMDGDTETDSGDMLRQQGEIATVGTPILTLHPSRKEDPARWSRQVDHLKGAIDIRQAAKPNRPALILNEPMGIASRRTSNRFGAEDSERIAAMLFVGMMIGGVVYHRIPEQDSATPNIEACKVAAKIPCSPDFQFFNAGTGGAPVGAFSGYEKVRTIFNGSEAWACGYGPNLTGASMEWRVDGAQEFIYQSDQVHLIRVR